MFFYRFSGDVQKCFFILICQLKIPRLNLFLIKGNTPVAHHAIMVSILLCVAGIAVFNSLVFERIVVCSHIQQGQHGRPSAQAGNQMWNMFFGILRQGSQEYLRVVCENGFFSNSIYSLSIIVFGIMRKVLAYNE